MTSLIEEQFRPVKEVAEELGCSDTLLRLACKHTLDPLPSKRRGKFIYVQKFVAYEYVKTHTRRTPRGLRNPFAGDFAERFQVLGDAILQLLKDHGYQAAAADQHVSVPAVRREHDAGDQPAADHAVNAVADHKPEKNAPISSTSATPTPEEAPAVPFKESVSLLELFRAPSRQCNLTV